MTTRESQELYDATTVLLSNLEKNIKIDRSQFSINLPSGTKVIKS